MEVFVTNSYSLSYYLFCSTQTRSDFTQHIDESFAFEYEGFEMDFRYLLIPANKIRAYVFNYVTVNQ